MAEYDKGRQLDIETGEKTGDSDAPSVSSNGAGNGAGHTSGVDGEAIDVGLPFGLRQQIGFFGGLLLFLLMVLWDAPQGLSPEGWSTAAVATLMAIWWVCEVLPIPATAMLPLILFPVLDVSDIGAAAAPYANPMIFLFLGGFVIAIAMQRWELHRRIALSITTLIGSDPRSIFAGSMFPPAFLSSGVSKDRKGA